MGRVVHWIFEDRTSATGRLVVGQWPNPPLWVFIVGAIGRRVFSSGAPHAVFAVVAAVALVAWALLEIAKGVNPFRRALGAVVLAVVLAGVIF